MKHRKIRELREERGWSLRGVARYCVIDPKSLSLAERGLGPLYPGWRRRLAEMFGVPEDELSEEAE
jgi:transcriptional regulator with XRE-family HTH domain